MRLHSTSFEDGAILSERLCFGAPDGKGGMRLGGNRSPHLAWQEAPEAAQSFILICHDPDVPADRTIVNVPDTTIRQAVPRTTLYHWVVVDIPPDVREFAEGEFSDGITMKGKPGPNGPRGVRLGLNSYTEWLKGNPDMEGSYYGYDGPCPPLNDSVTHRYIFTLYAMDFARCPVAERFTGADVVETLRGHVLKTAKLTGLYHLNPKLRGTP